MKEYSTIVGMDLGDKYSNWALMVEHSEEILEEGRVRSTREAMERKFRAMAPALVIIEAGTHSPWVSRLLEAFNHKVLVANPRRLRCIYQNHTKTDRLDAQTLARLGRSNQELLYPIQHRGERAQEDRAILQGRDALVKGRTGLINHVRGRVKSAGYRLPSCSADCFAKKIPEELPESLKPALGPILAIIGEMTEQIFSYESDIEELCEKEYPETLVLREIKGVGPITALAFVLTLEDPNRFAKSRDVPAYLGLLPRRDQSGDHDPQLPISKAGDAYLRRLLVGAAQYLLGPLNNQESELREWGLKLAGPVGRNGRHNKRLKKRAVVAVARKLAVLMHRLWLTGECYAPFHHTNSCKPMEQVA